MRGTEREMVIVFQAWKMVKKVAWVGEERQCQWERSREKIPPRG